MVVVSDEARNRKYVMFGCDPIMLALSEHLDVKRAMCERHVYESDRVVLLYNNGVTHPRNVALWQWCKDNGRLAYCVERASLPNMSMIDRNGMLADSSSYDEANWNHPLTDEQRKATLDYIKELTTGDMSLEKQLSGRMDERTFWATVQYDRRKYGRVVFVPLQKENDTTIRMWSRWVQSVGGFTKIIYNLAAEKPGTLFVVKPHPLSQVKALSPKSNVCIATGLNYKDCIAYSDKVFVINSGVGLQAMAWDKPLFVFGKSHYCFPGIGKQVDNMEMAHEAVVEDIPLDHEKMLRYIWYLRHVLWSCVDLSNGAKNAHYTEIRMN